MNQNSHIDSMLSIYELCRQGTRVLGPGVRYVIWTQGCPFHCEGCLTPNSRPISAEKQAKISMLAEDILSRPYIEGITISGGEPFLQAAALASLLNIVLTERPELNVITYTGFTIDSLSWPEAQNLIEHLDLIIDGPYIKSLNDDKGLRGSSNQKFHFLTSRLLPWKDEMENGKRKVEYHIYNEIVKAFGVPSTAMIIENN